MRRALELAATGRWPDPNPRVGCVLVDASGCVVAEGAHAGAGTPHAEAVALRAAGERARGSTAYVSLEPCAHTGRTGPCADALVAAGVTRVVFGEADPTPEAGGGAHVLRRAGVEVVAGVLTHEAAALNERWTRTVTLGRPLVTWKLAATLDGRSAAADGSSQWITGPEARADVHALRATRDAVVVGTGTLLADDPQLTARMPQGGLASSQPLRVVMGLRAVPDEARVHEAPGQVLHLATRDPHVALIALWDSGIRDIWLEGGPTVAAAFVRAGLVDEVYAYLAPALLGAGRSAVSDLGVTTMSQIRRLVIDEVGLVGTDVRIRGRLAGAAPSPAPPGTAPRSYSAAEHLAPWGLTD